MRVIWVLLFPAALFGQALGITAPDGSVNPCSDFYQYACGTWMKQNPIPPDQPSWGRFQELGEHNRLILRQTLEQLAAGNPKRSPDDQKLGDYYASCMDEATIDARGIAPLESELKRIRGLRDKSEIAAEVAHLHSIGAGGLFSFSSGQDFRDATQVIGQLDQGGLSLPDREYYLKQDPKSAALREKYVAHVGCMFELLGETPAKAKEDAATVMRLETALAEGSMDIVSRRNPDKVYHKMTRAELEQISPDFAWPKYFVDSGAPPVSSLNVSVPDFIKTMDGLLKSTSLDDWKTYFTWRLVSAASPLLPTPFVNEEFAFFGKTLTGASELKPRWKRCVAFTDDALGEALGRKYVEKTFGAEGKERTLKMVQSIEHAMGEDIEQLPWMSPATKEQALIKLHAITNKIGYPDKWRDYSRLKIVRGEALGNAFRAGQFEFHRDLNKIGKPVNPNEWEMTPPTVNAYYDPQMDNINFPAGILQPPFYSAKRDDAVNYGAIGAVIGHELTHAFDDEGRKFDAHGNLRDWWTAEDAKKFEQRADCLASQYSAYSPIPGVHLNGRLTLGENTADNGGLRVAYMALLNSLTSRHLGVLDGFTPEQRFFLGWAQIWCQNVREESMRMQVQVNPHSPGRFRVNGVVSNMPEFQKAFGCSVGQPMIAPKECRVW